MFIINLFRDYPELVLFFSIGGGYLLGRVKIFGFEVGATTGVLLVSLVLGQMDVPMPPLLETLAFAFFVFCMGYKVGPEFFGAVRSDGLKYIILAFFVCAVGLVTAWVLAHIFHFDAGTAAGLLGGGMTQSTVLGTAHGALEHLNMPTAQLEAYEGNIAVAYAITYIFGVAGLVVFFKLAPKLLRIDFKVEAKKLAEKLAGGDDAEGQTELFSWKKRLNLRAYRIENHGVVGKTVAELEAENKIAVHSIKRAGKVIHMTPETILEKNDIVGIIGRAQTVPAFSKQVGTEIYDNDVIDLTGEMLKICVLRQEAVDKTLGEISKLHGHGCFLSKLTRQGQELPLRRNTKLKKGDLLQVSGVREDVVAVEIF